MASGRRYAIQGFNITLAASKTILEMTSASTIRPKLYEINLGSPSTPADNAADFSIKRYTAAGTVTAVTPVALDNGDPAALAAGGKNATVEPTYTASSDMLTFAFNQRAAYRWLANPDSEIVAPATSANGLGLLCNAVNSAFAVSGSLFYVE